MRPVLDNFERLGRLLEGKGRPDPVALSKTDESGRFCLRWTGEGGVWRLVVHAPSMVPMQYFPLPLPAGTSVELPPVRLTEDAGTRVEVVDLEGRPVRAAVYARSTDTSVWNGLAKDGWTVVSRFGWTDLDGTLELPRSEGEHLDLDVMVSGFGGDVRARDIEGARFVLPSPRGRSLELKLLSDGEPVPGAVVAQGDATWPVGKSDSAGRLLVEGLTRRLASILVASEGGAIVREVVDLVDVSSGSPLTVDLPPARQIVGRVTDAGKTPIPGALAWIGSDPGRFAVSDRQGRFELTFPGAEPFWIQVQASGFSPQRHRVAGDSLRSRELSFVLRPSRKVQGRVVDSLGTPVATATVTGTVPGGAEEKVFRLDSVAARALSTPDGRFTLEVPAGVDCHLEAAKEGFHPSAVRLQAQPQGEGAEVLIRLARLAAGHGRVIGRNGDPLSGVRMRAFPAGKNSGFDALSEARREPAGDGEVVETNAKGSFEIPSLPAETIDLAAYKPGFSPVVVRDVRPELTEGSSDLGTLVLVPGVVLQGRVVDRSGSPVPEARVWQIDPSARTGQGRLDLAPKPTPDAVSTQEGLFLLEDLTRGKDVRLAVGAEGYRRSVVDLVDVPVGPDPVEIVLERDAVLRGRVVDPDGLPMPGVRVVAHARGADSGFIGPDIAMGTEGACLSGDDGTFEVSELEPGRYQLVGYGDGYLETDPWPVQLVAGQMVEGIELRLRRGAEVEGWVVDDTGAPIEGATVLVGRPAAKSDEDGAFSIRGVETGPATISVRHPDYAWSEREIEIEAGVNRVEVVLDRGVLVEGRTQTPDGRELEDVSIVLVGETSPFREYTSKSGADGRFKLEHVQPGTYGVEARREAMVPAETRQRAEVGSEGVEGLVVTLRPGAAISGQVRGVDLDELALLSVEATNPERAPRKGTVSHSGEYRVEPIAPGVWWVKATLSGGRKEAEARVVVEEDTSEVRQDLDLGTGVELTGRVLFETEPISEASISITGLGVAVSRVGKTDLEGRFSFGNLAQGRYRITVSDLHRMLVHNEVLELDADRHVEVRIEAGTVRGTVVSATTGETVPDALVILGQLEGTDEDEVSRVTVGTDTTGEFRIPHLSTASYRLTVGKDGFVPVGRKVEVHSGQSLDLHLELEPAAGLRIELRSAVDRELAWASVQMTNLDTGERIEETRPVDGSVVELPTAGPGRWTLLLAAPGHVVAQLETTVPGPEAEVVLQPAGRLTIQVPILDEQKLGGTVRLLGLAGEVLTGLDEETGGLRATWPWRRGGIAIDGVPAGQWVVEVNSADGSSWSRVVTAEGGVERELVFE